MGEQTGRHVRKTTASARVSSREACRSMPDAERMAQPRGLQGSGCRVPCQLTAQAPAVLTRRGTPVFIGDPPTGELRDAPRIYTLTENSVHYSDLSNNIEQWKASNSDLCGELTIGAT